MNEQIITCLVNKKNQTKFVLLEEHANGICMVINPKGEILHVGLHLFEEEPVLLEKKDWSSISDLQLTRFCQYMDELEAKEEKQRQVQIQATKLNKVDVAISNYKQQQRRRSSYSRSSKVEPQGLATTWNSSKLTFYKHKIEPLGLNQSFAINIEGVGRFLCTKKDFLSNFNEVVISSQYKNDGLYSFSIIPEKAYKFITPSSQTNSMSN